MSKRSEYWQATLLYRWEDAPPHLQALIPPARQGLWLAVVPRHYAEETFRWMAALGPMVSRHPLTEGDLILIGAQLAGQP